MPYNKSNKKVSGFKMKGMSFKNSPLKQDKTNVPLSEQEKKKGTVVTGGSKSEEIADLEDRIEFLQSDIADAGQEGPTKNRAQLMKLKQQLAKLIGR